jgi:hypothetical protein
VKSVTNREIEKHFCGDNNNNVAAGTALPPLLPFRKWQAPSHHRGGCVLAHCRHRRHHVAHTALGFMYTGGEKSALFLKKQRKYDDDDDDDDSGASPLAKAASAPVMTAKDAGPCTNYRIDMTAARFGDCKCVLPASVLSCRTNLGRVITSPDPPSWPVWHRCGFPKLEHKAAPIPSAAKPGAESMSARAMSFSHAPKPASQPPRPATAAASPQSAPTPTRTPTPSTPSAGACDDYRIDMTAARFGDCK